MQYPYKVIQKQVRNGQCPNNTSAKRNFNLQEKLPGSSNRQRYYIFVRIKFKKKLPEGLYVKYRERDTVLESCLE